MYSRTQWISRALNKELKVNDIDSLRLVSLVKLLRVHIYKHITRIIYYSNKPPYIWFYRGLSFKRPSLKRLIDQCYQYIVK